MSGLAKRLLELQTPAGEEAARHLTVAASLVPDSAGLWHLLGEADAAAGDEAGAAAAYAKAVELDPEWDAPREAAARLEGR